MAEDVPRCNYLLFTVNFKIIRSSLYLQLEMSSAHSGGLSLTNQMRDILNQPGYLSIAKGGQKLRELYQKREKHLSSHSLGSILTALQRP